jgi:hypothetical protein
MPTFTVGNRSSSTVVQGGRGLGGGDKAVRGDGVADEVFELDQFPPAFADSEDSGRPIARWFSVRPFTPFDESSGAEAFAVNVLTHPQVHFQFIDGFAGDDRARFPAGSSPQCTG